MTFQLIGGDTNNTSEIVNQVNQNIATLKAQDVTNIFKDDTGTRRVLLGKGKDGFYGLKVSQPGIDVFDGASADMVFNSDNNTFKIVDIIEYTATSAISITFPGGATYAENSNTIATIPHNLGYAPAFLAYQFFDPGYQLLPYSQFGGAGTAAIWVTYNVLIDETNIILSVDTLSTGTGSSTVIFPGNQWKIYLLQETAN